MTLKIAICDDDIIVCEELQRKLKEISVDSDFRIIQNGEVLLMEAERFDLLFLDIEMPQINGLELAKMLRQSGYAGEIIFLTSHDEVMAEGYKVHAFRFLTKPIDMGQLREAIADLLQEMDRHRKLGVEYDGVMQTIDYLDIRYIESDNRNSKIITEQGTVMSNRSLKDWLAELPELFKVNKSCAISFYGIERIFPGEVKLKDVEVCVPVARRRRSELREKYFTFIKMHAKKL